MEKASEALFGLNPVTFRYKRRLIPRESHSLAWWPRKWKR